MICQEFDDLTHKEQSIMQAEILELIRKDGWYFTQCQYLIERGRKQGILKTKYYPDQSEISRGVNQ